MRSKQPHERGLLCALNEQECPDYQGQAGSQYIVAPPVFRRGLTHAGKNILHPVGSPERGRKIVYAAEMTIANNVAHLIEPSYY